MRYENKTARSARIPKWLRQYHARYGKGGVDAIVQTHAQNPGSMLDHGAEKKVAMQKLVALIQGHPAEVGRGWR